MRVAVFTDNDADAPDGVTTTLEAVVRCAPPDVTPRIYTAQPLPVDQPEYLALAAAGMPLPFHGEVKVYWPSWRELERRILSDGVTLLHLTTPGPIGLAALWLARRTGLPMVGSFHSDFEAYTVLLSGSARLGRWMGRYVRWVYAHCEMVLVPSTAACLMLVARGLPVGRVSVWPRGVDTEVFHPDRRSASMREAWRAGDAQPVLLYAGSLSRPRGVMAIPALSDSLRRAAIDHRVVFVGEGPLRRQLAAACPEAVFIDRLGRQDMATALASADVVLCPAETDTGSNTVLEAQAAGAPVIVSSRAGVNDCLTPNVSGFVCVEPASWRVAVASLLASPDVRKDMSLAARQLALAHRWDVALTPLYDTYRRAGGVYQNPSTFHQAKPIVSQMATFTSDTTKPTRHQSANDT